MENTYMLLKPLPFVKVGEIGTIEEGKLIFSCSDKYQKSYAFNKDEIPLLEKDGYIELIEEYPTKLKNIADKVPLYNINGKQEDKFPWDELEKLSETCFSSQEHAKMARAISFLSHFSYYWNTQYAKKNIKNFNSKENSENPKIWTVDYDAYKKQLVVICVATIYRKNQIFFFAEELAQKSLQHHEKYWKDFWLLK